MKFRWDTRKLNEPLERLYMDPLKTDEQVLSRSYGISVLEYETTMPTKFMCGTDMGMVFSCNRKGKTPMEKITIRVRLNMRSFFFLVYLTARASISDDVSSWTCLCNYTKSVFS